VLELLYLPSLTKIIDIGFSANWYRQPVNPDRFNRTRRGNNLHYARLAFAERRPTHFISAFLFTKSVRSVGLV